MRDTLLAHELLCLQLKSFYGVERCSPSQEASTLRVRMKKGGKFRSTRLRKWR